MLSFILASECSLYYWASGLSSGNLPEASRTAAFLHPTYVHYLRSQLTDHLRTICCHLHNPTYGPYFVVCSAKAVAEFTEGSAVHHRGVQNRPWKAPWPQMPCKLLGRFRQPSGNSTYTIWKLRSPLDVPAVRLQQRQVPLKQIQGLRAHLVERAYLVIAPAVWLPWQWI